MCTLLVPTYFSRMQKKPDRTYILYEKAEKKRVECSHTNKFYIRSRYWLVLVAEAAQLARRLLYTYNDLQICNIQIFSVPNLLKQLLYIHIVVWTKAGCCCYFVNPSSLAQSRKAPLLHTVWPDLATKIYILFSSLHIVVQRGNERTTFILH